MSEVLKFQVRCRCLDPSWIIHFVKHQFYLCGAVPKPFEMKRCMPELPVAREQRNYVATFFERGEQATSTQQDGERGLSQLDHLDSESNCHRCPLGNPLPSDDVITLRLRPRAITPSSGLRLPAGRLCQLDPSSSDLTITYTPRWR